MKLFVTQLALHITYGGTDMTTTNESSTPALVAELVEALRDMLSGWRYIRESHGDLYGVGWDRAQNKAEAALEKAAKSNPADIKATDDGPAFPHPNYLHEGMSLRQYAAIKLRVPDSGIDWLDDMIRTSMQDEFAAKAMQQIIPLCVRDSRAEGFTYEEHVAENAFAFADSMLKARG